MSPALSSNAGIPGAGPGLGAQAERDYVGGYNDDVVEEMAREDGEASVHSSAWGENVRPHSLEVINHAHDAQVHLVGHDLRAQVQDVVARLRHGLPAHAVARNTATQAVDSWKLAQMRLHVLTHRILSAGMALPVRRDFWKSLGILAVLFLGEWGLIAVGYQLLGLSDHALIPGVQFSDDLHLAALATVTLLVLLAHGAGVKLRRVEHDFEARRQARARGDGDSVPGPSILDIALMVAFLGVALAALVGVGIVRIDYLATAGIAAQAGPFLAIQIGILVAALFSAYHFTHPYERQWHAQETEASRTAAALDGSLDALVNLTGSVNADVALVDALVAQAGHHVEVDEANARRQVSLYARGEILAQPEIISERLLPEPLPAPNQLDGEDLLETLIGVTPRPYTLEVAMDDVVAHHEAAIREVRELAERLNEIETERALGGRYDSSEGGPVEAIVPSSRGANSVARDGEVAA